jgi:replication regulatory protein RepB
MNSSKETQILTAIRNSEPKKKRVTFFITEQAKDALATWCEKHDVTESGAIEEMIRATIPEKFFRKGE